MIIDNRKLYSKINHMVLAAPNLPVQHVNIDIVCMPIADYACNVFIKHFISYYYPNLKLMYYRYVLT